MIARRRPPAARFHPRRMLLLVTAFTLMIFPLTNADNSNYNTDDFDAPSTPEMAPIEDVVEENAESLAVEGREELLGTPNVLTPSVAAEPEGEEGDEDSLVADAPGGAATDTGTAGLADTAEASESRSHQQSPIVPAGGEEGDGSTAEEGTALEIEYNTRKQPAVTDEGNDTEQEGTGQEQEAGEIRDGNVQPDEETKEGSKETMLPAADGGSEETAGSGDIVIDGHHDPLEVLGSVPAKLSVPAAVTTDDDQADSSESITIPVDASAETAATAAAAKNEEQQQQQQRSSLSSSVSDNGSSLEAQAAAATAAAGATQAEDSAVAATESGDNDLEVSGSSSDDGVDGVGAVDDEDVKSGTSPPSSIAEPAAAGDREPQEPVRPGGHRSATGDAAAGSGVDNARPSQAEGSHGGGGGGNDDGDGGDGESSGLTNDDTAADRGRADSKAGRFPEGVEEETESTLSNRSSSSSGGGSGSSSGWNEAGGHERRDGDVEQGESGGPGGGSEGANRRDEGGGHRDDGASGGAEFPRGSPEELAQRVRDMEAELVRKLLAEEDAKSLLDIWVERAREYVLTQTVPPTDAECDFSWSRLRCEPKCLCGARLRFGDYTPGRACRLLHPWERSPELCGEDGADPWDPSDEPAFRRAAAAVAGALGGLRRAYEARVAPPSDPECHFSLETRRCEPQPLCRLRLRWGDISLTNGCRLAAVPEEKKPGGGATRN